MSFLRRLLGKRKPGTSEYLSAMVEMANESERTYRGMIQSYNEDVAIGVLNVPSACKKTVIPTGRGLYKARLFGALFIANAYTVSGHTNEEVQQMINVATGLALSPLVESKELSFSREDAQSLTTPYLFPTLKAITAGIRAGPLVPMSPISDEHSLLANKLHDALAESIGVDCYTTDVIESLKLAVIGNVAAAMAHSNNWIFR